MRILAASDIHGNREVYGWLAEVAEERRPEAIVLAGDLLGVPDGHDTVEAAQSADAGVIAETLSSLDRLVLFIMGNDDWVELPASRTRLQSLHGRRFDLGSFNFVGYQYSLPFMGGIFEKPEEGIARDLAVLELLMDASTVLVTHCPAYGLLDLGILDEHAGSRSILSAVRARGVRAHIHGHIHECFGRQERHFNVAAAGRHRAMLIDLTTMTHEVLRC